MPMTTVDPIHRRSGRVLGWLSCPGGNQCQQREPQNTDKGSLDDEEVAMRSASHHPRRLEWPRPWRRVCVCGLRWPCPDELWQPAVSAVPDGDRYRGGTDADPVCSLTP